MLKVAGPASPVSVLSDFKALGIRAPRSHCFGFSVWEAIRGFQGFRSSGLWDVGHLGRNSDIPSSP